MKFISKSFQLTLIALIVNINSVNPYVIRAVDPSNTNCTVS